MAEKFLNLKEAAAQLGKSEEQVKDLVKQGKLREYHNGPNNTVYKSSEIEAFSIGLDGSSIGIMPDGSSIGLVSMEDSAAPAKAESAAPPVFDLGDDFDLTKDDTQLTGQGINILGESDEFSLTDDTVGKTAVPAAKSGGVGQAEPSLEKLEEDVNLDSFGSGSGLLDLSLQADDTSLGGVLDEIYPGADLAAPSADAPAAVAEPTDVAAEAEQIFTESEAAVATASAMNMVAMEPAPDKQSNMLGLMLAIPLLATIYMGIILAAAVNNTVPGILVAVQDIFWYIMGGAAFVSLVIMVIGLVSGEKQKTRTA